jgi:hypothetical protein
MLGRDVLAGEPERPQKQGDGAGDHDRGQVGELNPVHQGVP